MNKTLLIIPARGGSKRIPHKNMKDFLGKPIIEYSIRTAIDSCEFSEVMVSTDSQTIAEFSKSRGVNIPFLRSEKNSNDFATTTDVLLEVINEYENLGKNFEYFCCLYPTAPFVTPAKLQAASKMLRENAADFVLPVVRFSYPIQRALQIEDGIVSMQNRQFLQTRSQDLTPMYHDCGQFYFGRVDSLRKHGSFLLGKVLPILTSELEMQDIDNEEDWKLAELKYSLRTQKNQKA